MRISDWSSDVCSSDLLPPDIAADGRVRLLAYGVRRIDRLAVQRARALSLRLDNGQLLVLARSTSVVDQVDVILRQSLLWDLSLTLIPGLIGGYLLSRGPLRRVRTLEAAVQPIGRAHDGTTATNEQNV